ncbi:MAG TPA: hypothetical protein PLX83_21115 [bacterium]|nr:hypothetical protein [bacterium]
MSLSLRPRWRNCVLKPDPEIREIDRWEDRIAPLPPNVSRIRELISTLELCHHKAGRWIQNILEAIGAGDTQKGLGTRSPDHGHPAEGIWQNTCAALSAWCAGSPASPLTVMIDTVPAAQMLAGLGERSPLKEWQVYRVIEKIRSVIHWPRSCEDPTTQYVWLLLGGEGNEMMFRDRCPQPYLEHEDFWQATVRTLLHDTVDGCPAVLSLGLAIDMLWPCHWRFSENLRIVLGAIGGSLHPEQPFTACGRNIACTPLRRQMETISNTLRVFASGADTNQEMHAAILVILGVPTETKRWLAASLDKTIRLQLDPPPDIRALSRLEGPDWINQE